MRKYLFDCVDTFANGFVANFVEASYCFRNIFINVIIVPSPRLDHAQHVFNSN